jgi:hypothetical protein
MGSSKTSKKVTKKKVTKKVVKKYATRKEGRAAIAKGKF